MNNDLISREALKKRLNEMFDTVEVMLFDDIIATIDSAPTVNYPFYAEAYQTGYEEGKNEIPQSSLEKPLYKGVLFVDDYGINKVIEVDENGTVTAERIIPRDTFIEAYNKFINTDMKGGVK